MQTENYKMKVKNHWYKKNMLNCTNQNEKLFSLIVLAFLVAAI